MNFIVIFENHRSKLISDFVSDPYGPLNFLEDIFWEYILVLGGESSDLGSQRAIDDIFSIFFFSSSLSFLLLEEEWKSGFGYYWQSDLWSIPGLLILSIS